MAIEAETLLLATGLLQVPERSHLLAGPVLLKELRDTLVAAFDREDPARLTVYPERKTYFDRLSVEPDYTSLQQDVEALAGTDVADDYVFLHQQARDKLLAARPRIEIMTVMGPEVMPLDSISQGRWDLLVDAIESARVCKDVAAGALLKGVVDMFQAAFPAIYVELRKVEDDEINKRRARKKSWAPEPWLANSLLVFEGKTQGETLSAVAGAEPEPSKHGKPNKGVKIQDLTKALATPAQDT